MRLPIATVLLVCMGAIALAQTQSAQTSFEVASVRPSQNQVGPDYNNQIVYSPDGFTGRNVTLRRIVAEAWHCQLDQVIGPPWLDRNEYDISARLTDGATREQIPVMLRGLLFDRFRLKEHGETRPMRVYELTVAKDGPRIRPSQPGEATPAGQGFRFRGDMRQFADLLAVQFSIPAPTSPGKPVRAGGPAVPVLDKTALHGIYEFSVDVRPELGTDAFTAWKRALDDQLGLKIESVKAGVPVVVIDDAAKMPTAN